MTYSAKSFRVRRVSELFIYFLAALIASIHKHRLMFDSDLMSDKLVALFDGPKGSENDE